MGERFHVPVLNRGIVDNVLAAFGVLRSLGYDPREFRERLTQFRPPAGRMNLLNFGSFYLIDDTYNANPPSVRNAIITLSSLPSPSKKIAVLGDMLEMGEDSERLHREIGALLAKSGVEFTIFHGRFMFYAWEECMRRGGKGVFLEEKEDVLEETLKWTKDKNIILLKGSRGMRMETLVEQMKGLFCYEF